MCLRPFPFSECFGSEIGGVWLLWMWHGHFFFWVPHVFSSADGKKIGCRCACGGARWSCPFSSSLQAPTEITGTPLPFETWKSFFLHHNFIRRFECEYEMFLCHTGADIATYMYKVPNYMMKQFHNFQPFSLFANPFHIVTHSPYFPLPLFTLFQNFPLYFYIEFPHGRNFVRRVSKFPCRLNTFSPHAPLLIPCLPSFPFEVSTFCAHAFPKFAY